jgi:hypothetical protein
VHWLSVAVCVASRREDIADRYPFNHRIGMVEMDKIVNAKRSWVYFRQPNLQEKAITLVEGVIVY